MKKPRIVIADDHEITRIGAKSIIGSTGLYDICGEAADGHEAVEKTYQLKPDLLLLDVGLPYLNGVEVARRIGLRSPQTSVLMFTEIESERVMLDALRVGVKGFIIKTESADDLLSGIEIVLHGKTCFSPRIGQILLNFARQHGRADVLTTREKEIVQLVAEGHCTKEVAHMLAMSVKTAETHRSNIFRKVHVNTTAELVLYAVRNQIVHITSSPEERVLQFAAMKEPVAELPSHAVAAA